MTLSPIKIKIASDIHLEYYKGYEYITHNFDLDKNTILILAGDIGKPSLSSYGQFLAWVSSKCMFVILVAGNHEYYHSRKVWSHVVPLIKQKTSLLTNLYFLNNSSIILEGIKFIGSTLWSNTKNTFEVETIMNDYHNIKSKIHGRKCGIGRLTTSLWYQEAVSYIESELLESKKENINTVLVTHHLPTFKSLSGDSKSGCRTAYATNLEYMFGYPLKAWIHGHHHKAVDFKMKSTRIISNPLGYEENTGYKKELSILLKDLLKDK